MERDNNTCERVTLTLLYVNQFMGRALAHLLVDSPHRWREFCDAVRVVDYHSPDWQAPSKGSPCAWQRLRRQAQAVSDQQHSPAILPSPGATRRRARRSCRTLFRRQIPWDGDGREPCLRFLAGGNVLRRQLRQMCPPSAHTPLGRPPPAGAPGVRRSTLRARLSPPRPPTPRLKRPKTFPFVGTSVSQYFHSKHTYSWSCKRTSTRVETGQNIYPF
ncbi:hypothetical protein PR001_g14674 [Phytophthora rubi]|uniref:Uncharacterized protein n=1 Tax=Phytophthora rubi TaxID=129364 RepID=A0A6A3LCI7_9STRA|nr:hypothetical protein PR001_g14674 [Phytophthora rubi]